MRSGWPGLVAHTRGIARALGGVIVDARTWLARPIHEHTAPLFEVPLTEMTSTISVAGPDGRWLFRTVGLANLGLPDLWFDGIDRGHSQTAFRVIQGLRDAFVARAAEHVASGRSGPLEIAALHVPRVGEVPVTRADHPLVGRRSVRADWGVSHVRDAERSLGLCRG